MKGIIFTQLLEMVESSFGYDTHDNVLEKANLSHDGLYISGGTYPHSELISIIRVLSDETKIPISNLLKIYGKHLFKQLARLYPKFLKGKKTPIEFIATVDDVIHVEVKKLYPDAELPRFKVIQKTNTKLILDYSSIRKMEDFAVGMIESCGEFYNMPIKVSYKPLEGENAHKTRFTIKLLPIED